MNYRAKLFLPKALYPCYAPEARKDDRVKVKVSLPCEIDIKASDAISLRASLTTLTKLLSVYEKIEKI